MSISARSIGAIFRKQLSDFYRNPNIIICAVLAPLFAFLYMRLLPSALDMGEGLQGFVLNLTCIMNLVMVGFMMMTYTIAEEKEKNTLRVLILSGVRPMEFLLGNGLCTMIVGFLCHVLLFFTCGMALSALPLYALGGLCALAAAVFLGSIVGLLSKNQVSASVLSVPILLLLMLLPIFATMNATLEPIAGLFFTTAMGSIVDAMVDPSAAAPIWRSFLVIAGNMAVFALLFALAYRRSRMEE